MQIVWPEDGREFGARLVDRRIDDVDALGLARERQLAFVHPFDDPDVIAGQGTIGMEIARQTGGNVDAVFVPVGGGGLIAGIAVYLKYVHPQIRIIGVNAADSTAMHDSLRAGERVSLPRVGIFADGVAVRRVGEEAFRLARGLVDEMILVDTAGRSPRDVTALDKQSTYASALADTEPQCSLPTSTLSTCRSSVVTGA